MGIVSAKFLVTGVGHIQANYTQNKIRAPARVGNLKQALLFVCTVDQSIVGRMQCFFDGL